jgi:hypothetical protein
MKAPITPPTSGAAQQQFDIERIDAMAPEAGQRIGGVQQGFPLWKLVWTLGNIGVDRTDAWQAFFDQIRGATRRFLAWDLRRPYPKAYASTGFAGMTRAGGGSFDGTATSWSETITADGDSEVTLHGLPAGFVLGAGDYIGFAWTASETSVAGLPWHAPVRIVTGDVADGSGVATRHQRTADSGGRSRRGHGLSGPSKVRDGAGHRSVEAERRRPQPGRARRPDHRHPGLAGMKTIDPDAMAAIEAGEAVVSGAIKITPRNPLLDPVMLWGGNGSITIDGDDYMGIGDRGLAQQTNGALGGVAQGLNLTLSGIEPAALALLDPDEVKDATVVARRLIFASDCKTLLDAHVFERGRGDTLETSETIGADASIVYAVENAARGLGRSGARQRSDSDQRLINPDDGYFKNAAFAAQKMLYWGGKKPSRAGAALGGSGSATPFQAPQS